MDLDLLNEMSGARRAEYLMSLGADLLRFLRHLWHHEMDINAAQGLFGGDVARFWGYAHYQRKLPAHCMLSFMQKGGLYNLQWRLL